MIAKERELRRFHSELIAKEEELKRWKEELIAENQALERRCKELDDREKRIKEKDSSDYSRGMLHFLMVDRYALVSKDSSLSPSLIRQMINTKSYSLLNAKITH
jgi:predicted transcriptional regulator